MKSKFLLIAALAIFVCLPTPAKAQVEPGSFNFSIMGGGIFPTNLYINNGFVGGVGLGYNFTENWGLEAFFHLAPNLSDRETPAGIGDNDIFSGRLNAIYHFGQGILVPYVTAGIGGIKDDRELYPNYSSFTVNAGLGLKFFLNDTIAIRLEAADIYGFRKYSYEKVDERLNAPLLTAGLTLQFGGGEAGPCADSDHDGVCDAYDACPGTPLGTPVKSDGCPVTVEILLDVEFDFDKDVVKPQYRAEVEKAAIYLNNHPNAKALLEGHTDSKGNDDYNMKLSQRRADSVRRYLTTEFNVDPARLTAEGFGETRPVDTNDTEEGRAHNRRVVAIFTE
ncbi:MAG: OmpA family protein [Deltaproteobacteria bacterium]|jgi:OOP family OmpA-OmpF porin|nr:OmpA family protein [Deltaproteobacteria bacterium]